MSVRSVEQKEPHWMLDLGWYHDKKEEIERNKSWHDLEDWYHKDQELYAFDPNGALPLDIIRHILEYLDLPTFASYGMVSRGALPFFHHSCNKILENPGNEINMQFNKHYSSIFSKSAIAEILVLNSMTERYAKVASLLSLVEKAKEEARWPGSLEPDVSHVQILNPEVQASESEKVALFLAACIACGGTALLFGLGMVLMIVTNGNPLVLLLIPAVAILIPPAGCALVRRGAIVRTVSECLSCETGEVAESQQLLVVGSDEDDEDSEVFRLG